MFKEKLNKDFIVKFNNFIVEHKLIEKRSKILVGFSGGPDSTALLLALLMIKDSLDLSLLVAHVNYNLRGQDSQADEDFVKEFCFSHNLYLVINRVNIESDSNIEATARDIRMNYFYSLLRDYKLDAIALGHNQGDNAETVMMNLIRGAGITGLRGILPKSNKIIHPLLNYTRCEICSFLEEERVVWREDKSNQETAFTRNKIRNQLIPWISENLNPTISDKLVSLSSLMVETEDFIEDYIDRSFKRYIVRHTDDRIELSLKTINNSKKVLRYYLFKKCLSQLTGLESDVYQNNINEIENILGSEGSKMINFPNKVFILKEYDYLIFTTKNPVLSKNKLPEAKTLDSIRPRLSFGAYRIKMKKIKKLPSEKALANNKNIVFLDYDKIKFPLTIRNRDNGDRFIPLGIRGFKKLKDFFIDEKVSKFDRDKIPIFTDTEKIIWVGGMRIDNRVAINQETTNILRIELEKVTNKKMRSAERKSKG
ncbi:tRNA lysidine(34) synthetase TilS [bacterium]|nr:tRNA lysidine(34) synthetase TilS [bacterium]